MITTGWPGPDLGRLYVAHVLQSVLQENKAPEAETSRLHVGHLTRNVQQEHIHEIFSTFGTVKHVELAMDKAVNLPRGFAYVELSKRSEAEEAQRLMDGGQLDGNQLRHATCYLNVRPLLYIATCFGKCLLMQQFCQACFAMLTLCPMPAYLAPAASHHWKS